MIVKRAVDISLLVLACAAFAACGAPEAKQDAGDVATRGEVIRKEMPLTPEQQAILEELEPNVDRFSCDVITRLPRNEEDRGYYAPPFSEITFSTLPVYELDLDMLFGDCASEHLMECIRQTGDILFLGRHKGRPVIMIQAVYVEGVWWPAIVRQGGALGGKLSWLPERLEAADPDNYYCIPQGMEWLFVLHYNGRPEFYTFTGAYHYDAGGFCAMQGQGMEVAKANEKAGFGKCWSTVREIALWQKHHVQELRNGWKARQGRGE